MLRALVREARPKQWVKNVLVFAAPGAARRARPTATRWPARWSLFVAFCIVSSGHLLLERHPRRRARPPAPDEASPPDRQRAIPLGAARVSAPLGSSSALALATAVRWQAGAVVAVYVVLTMTYSAIWKHIAVVDLSPSPAASSCGRSPAPWPSTCR